MRTLSDLVFHIRETAAGRPDLLSVRRAADGAVENLSTSDALSKIHTLALAFERQGAVPGDRVAIWSENRPEWLIIDLAAHLLGLVVVGLDPDLSDEQLAFILRNSGCSWIFYGDGEKRDRLLALAGALTSAPRAVALEDRDVVPGGSSIRGTSITRLMGESAERRGQVPLERLRDRVVPEDPAAIVYALGEGASPRGVLLSHGGLAAVIDALDARIDCGPRDRALSVLPLADLAQRTVDYLCLTRGAGLCYSPLATRLDAAFARVRPTLLHVAPWVLELARARIGSDLENGSPWRRWLVGRALDAGRHYADAREHGFVGPLLAARHRLAELVLRRLRRRFGGALRLALASHAPSPETASFFEAFGLPIRSGLARPEAGSWLTLGAPGHHRPGSLGRPLDGVELRIAGDGEILARGPGIMLGYWQSSEATAAAIDPDGWLRTGVHGRLDEDGFLFLDRPDHTTNVSHLPQARHSSLPSE